MRISNTPDFKGATWQKFQPQVEKWQLGSIRSHGVATVYVQFRDAQGNVGEMGLRQADTILYRLGQLYLPIVYKNAR